MDWTALGELRRSVREYLDTLDQSVWGAPSEVKPKIVSKSDPAAQWTAAMKGHAFFAYATNYLIDLQHAVIFDFEASRAIRQAEVGAARTMIERTQDRFDLWPARLAADSAYGSAENLAWLVHERGIEPNIPVFDKSERQDGAFSRSEFTYNHGQDAYVCPAGKLLRQRQRTFRNARPLADEDGMMRYRASKHECRRLLHEASVLPQHAGPQDPTLDPRRGSRYGSRHRHLRSTSPHAGSGKRWRCCSRI